MDVKDFWTKAFLYARFHEMEKAMETMEYYYKEMRKEGKIPQKVIEKLEGVNDTK